MSKQNEKESETTISRSVRERKQRAITLTYEAQAYD